MKQQRSATLSTAVILLALASCADRPKAAREVHASAPSAPSDGARSPVEASRPIEAPKPMPDPAAPAVALIGELSNALATVADAASAQAVAQRFESQVPTLAGAKDALASHAHDLELLKQSVADAKTRLATQPDALTALQPLFDALAPLVP